MDEAVHMTSPTFIDTGTRRADLDPGLPVDRSHGQRRLRLLPSGDGWSLVTLDGRLVFSALGLAGRQRCLEFARGDGVGVLVSDY